MLEYREVEDPKDPLTANADGKNQRSDFLKNAVIAFLGVAVLALSVCVGILLTKGQDAQTVQKDLNHAVLAESRFNTKFAMHDEAVSKDLKPRRPNEVMRRYNYTHSTSKKTRTGVLTSITDKLDMYMDVTDELAFGELANDYGQVTPYSLRVRVRNITTGCDAFIVPFGVSTRLVGDEDSDRYPTMWPTFFHFSHSCTQDENVPVDSQSFVSELYGSWEFSNPEARAAWDRTVVPWLTNYCTQKLKAGGACVMPDDRRRRMLWTARGVGSRIGGWAGGKVGGAAGGAVGGAVGGSVGDLAGPVGGAIGGEMGEHYGSQIGSHYGHQWGARAGGSIGAALGRTFHHQ